KIEAVEKATGLAMRSFAIEIERTFAPDRVADVQAKPLSDQAKIFDQGRHANFGRHFADTRPGEGMTCKAEDDFAFGIHCALHETTANAVQQIFSSRAGVAAQPRESSRLF